MSLSRRDVAAVAALCAVAFLAGHLVGQRSTDALGEELRRLHGRLDALAGPRAPESVQCTAVVDAEVVRAELRRVLQQPLAERAGSEPTGARPPEPSPEQRQAFERGSRLVAEALAARRWTEENRTALRQLLPVLTDASREELFRTLIPAVNEGRIQVETWGPMY